MGGQLGRGGVDEEDAKALGEYYSQMLYKVSIMGSSKVGKTTYLKRLTQNAEFNPNEPFVSTIGCEFGILKVPDPGFTLQLWDLSGQNRFRDICKSYIRSNSVGIFMYSVNFRYTWDELTTYYLPLFREYKGPSAFGLLIGNVTNKEGTVEVDPTEAQAFALKEGLFWCQFDLSTVQPAELISKLTELVEKMQAQG